MDKNNAELNKLYVLLAATGIVAGASIMMNIDLLRTVRRNTKAFKYIDKQLHEAMDLLSKNLDTEV